MNKKYIVKRNAYGQPVVCSEKTKARGKVKSIVLAVATASAMMASVDVVAATTLGENQTITDTTSVAIGNNVIATGADTVAVGDYTKATGDESTALGERATTFGNQATATGSYAFADGNQSTSNGHASSAMAIDTIAIGVNSGAAGGSMSKEDWDKLIVIDREIKELEPSQFTTTITTPPTEPDRTSVDEAEQAMNSFSTANLIFQSGVYATLTTEVDELPRDYQPFVSKLGNYNNYVEIFNNYLVEVNKLASKMVGDVTSDMKEFTQDPNNLLGKTEADFIAEYERITEPYKQLYNRTLNMQTEWEQAYIKLATENPELYQVARKAQENPTSLTSEDYAIANNKANVFNEMIGLRRILMKTTGRDIVEDTPETRAFAARIFEGTSTDGSFNRMLQNMFTSNISQDAFVEKYLGEQQKYQALVDKYNTALTEYEAAVAAGGTGGTTTTTTDLAAYEAALAEKRAELTRLANAAGFDGTFESLSDVFGSKAGRAIAIGNSAYVSGDESVGVGYGNKVTGNQDNVFGTHNTVTADNNNVVGNNNTVATEGNNILGNAVTFAVGVATVGNVALGNDSVIGAAVPTQSIDIRGTTYNFAGTNPTSVVTVGSEGNERQIQNVAAGRVTETSTDAINGSQLYAITETLKAIQAINPDDIADVITTEVNVTGGDNVQVNREGNNFTISATDTNTQSSSSVVDGKGLAVTATDNANGTKNYAFEAKIGDGLVFGDNGEIKATGTTLTAGDNITVEGDATNGYTIKATDTNTQSSASVVDGKGLTVTATDNANGTKNYAFETKIGDGLSFDENGAIKANGTGITAGNNVQVSGDTKNGFVISATDTNTQSSSSVVDGKGLTVTSTDNSNGTKNYAFEAKIGDGLIFGDKGEIKATGTTLTAGDNIAIEGDATNGYTIQATNTQSVVKAGNGVTVDVADNDIGTKDYTVSTKIGDGLTFGSNGEIKATGTIINAGDNITVTGDAINGYTISTKGGVTDEQLQDVINQINGIVDTNTQSTTSAGQGIVITETDNANGTKNYAVSIKATDGLTFDDNGNIKVSDTLVKAGDNVQVSGNAKDGFTVSVKGTEITAGDNVNVSGDANNGYTISVENMRTTVTGGQGAEVTSSDNTDGSKNYTVNVKVGEGLTYDDKGNVVNDMKLTAGENIQVSGDAKGGYIISATDTNTQATVSADKGIIITETDNANGTKNYAVSIKATDGLTFDDKGNIKVSDTLVKAGDNVQVSGNAKDGFTVSAKGTEITAGDNVNVSGDANNGYTISVDNMRTTVTGGQGAEVTSLDNTDGSKNYTVNVKVGEGLTYDDKGNVVNDMKLTAGDNVQVSGDAKGGYIISATDTNTQATVSADKGITITETDNANGTKNYAVSAKLGKGLKVDENGAIAATAQPINGGAGVSITTNAQDEAVVNVAGVTTTTDDGKSYARSDLTKSVGVKGDGKNIRTSTAANGDVQVKLADDIQVNSVAIHNGPTINQQGINANNTRITNVQDGVAPTDAVNVRQLNQQGNIINQRIDNLADNVKKNKKRNDAGIASTAAMANIPQVMLAGKSGVGIGVGHRSGQSAIAVGYSRASDNAKHIIKLSAGLDTQSKATFGAGYMYQW